MSVLMNFATIHRETDYINFDEFVRGMHRRKKERHMSQLLKKQIAFIGKIWKENNYCKMTELAELSGHTVDLCVKVTSKIVQKKRF